MIAISLHLLVMIQLAFKGFKGGRRIFLKYKSASKNRGGIVAGKTR
jgi:hypothetical protein